MSADNFKKSTIPTPSSHDDFRKTFRDFYETLVQLSYGGNAYGFEYVERQDSIHIYFINFGKFSQINALLDDKEPFISYQLNDISSIRDCIHALHNGESDKSAQILSQSLINRRSQIRYAPTN